MPARRGSSRARCKMRRCPTSRWCANWLPKSPTPPNAVRRRRNSMERKPVAFGDMRNWMKALKAAGELREIDAEVDWNVELGTVTRMAQGPGAGPALLFKNIKDYNTNTTTTRAGG